MTRRKREPKYSTIQTVEPTEPIEPVEEKVTLVEKVEPTLTWYEYIRSFFVNSTPVQVHETG